MESTSRTRLLTGETQGKRVQDEERNTLRASQQAPAMAQEQEKRIGSSGEKCIEQWRPALNPHVQRLDILNWATCYIETEVF